ncbi:cyclic nucleotide-binding domain-containing protein [Streptomyces spectabilis]|uniref:Cyclic nucleotide-binding domain-containing protein n=2 Tax=Streptomyces spectabilis TaxID=68270 RepID=A0A5P2XI11_STRST|nr:cyclic nucleotide-binding domain-containing protein [Streptomyces spectabilis]MCI3907427.1 cyclic nucleotide-binding domain-containing protein [Streptomyces spectabilis]QEV64138.1 cyclic nucleotide-binding domain-containing protein [Streptomyces spectabilis]
MNTSSASHTLRSLPHEHRERLMGVAHEVSFPQGTRLFSEGGRADHFWVVRTGSIDLDMKVPGRRAAVIETLGHDELVGWSWLFGPPVWHLGAETASPVRAYEFDATAVRAMCQGDPAFGLAIADWVGGTLAHRLRSARTRLLDLYAPYGSGSTL